LLQAVKLGSCGFLCSREDSHLSLHAVQIFDDAALLEMVSHRSGNSHRTLFIVFLSASVGVAWYRSSVHRAGFSTK
jgi:hypothetical protein